MFANESTLIPPASRPKDLIETLDPTQPNFITETLPARREHDLILIELPKCRNSTTEALLADLIQLLVLRLLPRFTKFITESDPARPARRRLIVEPIANLSRHDMPPPVLKKLLILIVDPKEANFIADIEQPVRANDLIEIHDPNLA
jgi:hypothetical protein